MLLLVVNSGYQVLTSHRLAQNGHVPWGGTQTSYVPGRWEPRSHSCALATLISHPQRTKWLISQSPNAMVVRKFLQWEAQGFFHTMESIVGQLSEVYKGWTMDPHGSLNP